ncbi:anaphase-promoting complex subunit cdc20-like isoform X2 [Daphnia pulicaria]|uniref:anaphase-promoting complex subunit cdc20-like isoform X2 n=1 Tax=Daphnia pulicaria TaxID=35523 RepID=UPI001EE9C23B|nr:anaphase-promoting complex subunit cdc20-like isoform X2 [Daphnia pulicaria]
MTHARRSFYFFYWLLILSTVISKAMSATCLTSGSQQNSHRVPSFMFARHQHRSKPSSTRSNNIVDRFIPSRSETNMQLAQHRLSPMSHLAGYYYDSEQQDSPRQSTPILKFGNKVVKEKPMASLACGTTPTSKFKIPTSPHRVMPVLQPFREHGNQSTHWTTPHGIEGFVVALRDGVTFYYQDNENKDYTEHEFWNNEEDMGNPGDQIRHVICNSTGDSVISGSMGGEIQILDLKSPIHIKWRMFSESGIHSIALGQDHLLTCAASTEGVGVYDLRQTGGSTKPIFSLNQNLAAHSLSWSTNGHLLAVGCGSATSLWDVRHPSKAVNIFRNPGDENPVMNWCPWKPNVLFTSTSYPESSIRLHNATTGELIDDYECASEVSGIQFNVELEQIATSHTDFGRADAMRHIDGTESCVRLWEFTSNKLNPILKISYHEQAIISMAASANSQLLTLGLDDKLCLWHWNATNKTTPHSNANNEAGFQTGRSQLDTFNLIR